MYLLGVAVALLVALIEGVSYQGFLAVHLGIPSYWIYLLSFVLILKKSHYPKVVTKSLQLTALISSILYLLLIFIETMTYPNFVFTHTHINPFTFQFFIALLVFHTLVISQVNLAKSLLLAGLVYLGVDGAGRVMGIIYSGVKEIVSDPFVTYSVKMAKAYPGFYPAMQLVKGLTPEDATILIPPQGNPWDIEGNMAMVNYFLYPRTVKNLDPELVDHLPSNTYLLIAKGSWPRIGEMDYGWPKVIVQANQIWEFDTTGNTTHVFNRNYDPDTDRFDWGLIEVKHE